MKYLDKEDAPSVENEFSSLYKTFAEREEGETIDEIYDKGFIQTRVRENHFYLARSLRINLYDFSLNSENRRVLRKHPELKIEVVPLSKFQYHFEIGKWAKDFYDSRFGPKTFSAQKMKWVFTSGTFTHVCIYKENDVIIGYCPVLMTEEIMHYAYPFYSLDHENDNLGMAMMILAIEWAHKNDLRYVYLGSCQNEKALYKTQFKGVEFYEDEKWNDDIAQLKMLIRN